MILFWSWSNAWVELHGAITAATEPAFRIRSYFENSFPTDQRHQVNNLSFLFSVSIFRFYYIASKTSQD